MTEPSKDPVVSLSGSPIYRHGPESEWQAPKGEECLEQISAHIEQHLGNVETVFHELVSDTVHIDVHVVKADDDFPFWRLVTSGMSDLPMTTPADTDVARYVELMVTLPGDWKLDQESLEDPSWYWPVRLVKYLARFPHKHATWLGWGHTVPNGDPAEPYAPNTRLSGAIILPSVSVPDEFNRLTIDAAKTIHFLAVVPLYEEEMNFKLRSGTDELLDKFADADVSDIIDPKRRNVCKKRFGIF
jgi:hypothetical protein